MINIRCTFRRKASLLIISLWALGFLSVFGLYLGYGAKSKLFPLKRLTQYKELSLIAYGGVNKGILEILRDDDSSSDNFREEWANSENSFKERKLGSGWFNISYNYPEKGEKRKIWGIVDEARKINVNKASLNTLKRLFKIILNIDDLEAQEIAASIIDFRDSDSSLSIPLGSAEDSYYTNLKEPYACKNSDLEVIDELLLVKGITEDIFNKIKPFLTVYGEGGVNINTAPYEVLFALGIRERLLDKIIEYLRGEDNLRGTFDDNFFKSTQQIVPQLSQIYSLSIEEISNLSNLISQGKIITNSSYFMIESYAYTDYSPLERRVICVINRKGEIIYWREE